jgi:hypothetical protein
MKACTCNVRGALQRRISGDHHAQGCAMRPAKPYESPRAVKELVR